jgi:pimeloyl-ACP methyl ester carboxylesterase
MGRPGAYPGGRHAALAQAGIWLATVVLCLGALALPNVGGLGFGRLYVDQTYHHQVLRVLNHALAQGADISEVLEASRHVRAGDAQGWFTAFTALGDRNLARARASRDAQSRGQALLRAHTYYLRAEFFLPGDAPQRPASFERNRRAFYEGLDALGIVHEKLSVPFGAHRLNAVYYPPTAATPRAPLIMFCGGSDTTVEELYFFLVAAARARGYAVLTFEGPGQGAALREQKLIMTPDWEKPTAAVLDAFLAGHARPARTVLVGLSLGGYLAARAAAFEPRLDGLVAYDVFFDGREVGERTLPVAARLARRVGLGGLVNALAPLRARFDPASAWALYTGGWIFGKSRALDVVDALAAYRLDGVAARIRQDVLVLAGEEDQFVPVSQAEQFRRALVNARSVTVRVYDRRSGGSEHSQLGAMTLWQADLFDWIATRFPDGLRVEPGGGAGAAAAGAP